MIPCKVDLYVFAYQSNVSTERRLEVNEFQNLYGLDYSLLGKILCQKPTLRLEHFNAIANRPISEPVLVKTLDFPTLESEIFTQDFELEITRDGELSGYCAYFKAWLDDETILTNSPWAPQTHWTHMVYKLGQVKPIKQGDKLSMEVVYDGQLSFLLKPVV
jgi:hypothetical protein